MVVAVLTFTGPVTGWSGNEYSAADVETSAGTWHPCMLSGVSARLLGILKSFVGVSRVFRFSAVNVGSHHQLLCYVLNEK